MNDIRQCGDCDEHFCTVCDDEFTHCPDCEASLCGVCSQFALDQRMCRCLCCWTDDLTRVRYTHHDDKFTIFGNYSAAHTGRLSE